MLYNIVCGGVKTSINDIGERYQYDDIGENISELNPYYNELTGLYWIWKNSDASIVGLCHYRRYFFCPFHDGYFHTPITRYYIAKYLKATDIIVQRKANYGKYSNWEQYCQYVPEIGLLLAEEAIDELSPDYSEAFKLVMRDNGMFSCNMFICYKDLIDGYCEWIFPILDYIHSHLDYTDYTPYMKRTCGFLAERLFNVWIVYNRLKVVELPFGDWRKTTRIKWVMSQIKSKYCK